MWKLRRWVISGIVLTISSTLIFAQHTLDSLKNELDAASDSTEKMLLYKAIGNEYLDEENDEQALENYEAYLALSLALDDSLNILSGYFNVIQPLIYLERLPENLEMARIGFDYAKRYQNLKYQVILANEAGIAYRKMGLGDSSLVYLNMALEAGIALNNKGYQSLILENKGNTQSNQGDFIGALQSYLAAQEIYRETKDEVSELELEYNLGVLYKKIGEFKKSLESYKKVLDHFIEQNDTTYISGTYHNIASLYQIQGELDSALSYVRKSFSLEDKAQNLCSSGNAVLLGEIYLDLGKYDSARYYFNEELIRMSNCDSRFYYAPAMSSLGELALKDGDIAQARKFYTKSFEFSNQNNYKEDILESAKGLHKVYLLEEDYQKALSYYQLYKSTEDSLLNLENTRKLAWMEANQQMNFLADSLEFQRQLSEAELNYEIVRQKEQRTLVIIISLLVLLLIIAGVLFYQKRKKELHREQLAREREQGLQNVLVATEAERNRISKDLHDGVGQQLSAIKLAMVNVAAKLDNEAKAEIDALREKFSRSADEVRAISHQMMPRTLMENGLVEAIEDLLQATFTYSEITCSFEHKHVDQRFGERIEITIFRILQELINNIIKHSQASQVNIQLYKSGAQLTLLVEDNGKGMDIDLAKGHGINNIKSRLNIINGKVNFETSQGTTAFVSVPLN